MRIINECTIAGVPCLQIDPYLPPVGTIILYHGWGSNIRDYLFFGSMISDWGYKVVIPELPHHGERGNLAYFDTVILQQYFWSVVIQAVEEASTIVTDILNTNDQPVGIIGNSAGGFIAGGVCATNSNVNSAVVMNASCAWLRSEETFREHDGRSPMSAIEAENIRKYDPLFNIDASIDQAFLLLHGKEDTTIPIESQRYFMDRMSVKDIQASLKFVEYAGVNHQITLGMLQEAKEWMERYVHVEQ
ncbi:alpha/beta hydrolase [Paenibacillus illinoisensis]|uniref:Phospholipase-Carboxylesterase n=1 Tax=Paenibacillus illinoisensis TaxID=59845 RepID=A0A2W0CGK9_9BACL|nr:prolyl oligopeptidase family serine peptidase [Paenibacillus illinoisensis]PYY29969.1 Phospholipase-Carboxylesterase [Paenibacillus illinoisensis]